MKIAAHGDEPIVAAGASGSERAAAAAENEATAAHGVAAACVAKALRQRGSGVGGRGRSVRNHGCIISSSAHHATKQKSSSSS